MNHKNGKIANDGYIWHPFHQPIPFELNMTGLNEIQNLCSKSYLQVIGAENMKFAQQWVFR